MVQYFDFSSMLLSFVFDAMKFKSIGIWLNKSGTETATEMRGAHYNIIPRPESELLSICGILLL